MKEIKYKVLYCVSDIFCHSIYSDPDPPTQKIRIHDIASHLLNWENKYVVLLVQ